MYKSQKRNKYGKKSKNNNINQKENNIYHKENRRIYHYSLILSLIELIIKEIYNLIIIIILKIYNLIKIEKFPNKNYLYFLLIDVIINGGSIFYLVYSLINFYGIYSPFNQEWSYFYIWVIASIQLIYFFTSFILFLKKYVYIKIFFFDKFKLLFKIFCSITIIFNYLSLRDLNNEKYSFQIQNYEIKKLSNYKQYLKKYYINLYLNKDNDIDQFELCFEMKYFKNIIEILKKEDANSLWEFTKENDYFIGCRNISFKDNPQISKEDPLTFFKCDKNINNANILPNYCITAEQRRKKYNFIYNFNIFQIILLILCFTYGKIAHLIFRRYKLYNIIKKKLSQEKEKPGESEENEEFESEEEYEEDEGEEEEDDEEGEEEEEEKEEFEENKRWRRNTRKISKKRMKYIKKKQKNRFRKYNNNEQNEQNLIKEENNNNENKDTSNNIINEDNNKLNEEINNKKEKEMEKENKIDNNNEENDKNIKKKDEDNKKEEDNNENNKDINNDDDSYINKRKSYRKNSFLYKLFLGGIVDKIKDKFYNILKEIDKEIKEDEKND